MSPADPRRTGASPPFDLVCHLCGAPAAARDTACASCGGELDARTMTEPRARRDVPPPPRSGPLPEGTRLGDRYVLESVLGTGGMGKVYRARDRELERDVALKVILPEIADDPAVLGRFKREIQLSTQVTHKNVLRVYDLGDAGGVSFLTMQLVLGEDLGALLKREGKLPEPELLAIARQIARGLEAAHDAGIVHRDLKPRNVLLDRHRHVYVSDFGIAVSSGEASLSGKGDLVGSPLYMAPEQVTGGPVDARTDVYALGVILYRMATGELPFTSGTMFERMAQRLHATPRPVRELEPALTPELEAIVARCLAIEPEQRPASAGELATALDMAAGDAPAASPSAKRLPEPTEPPRPPPDAARVRRWLPVALAALLLAAGGAWATLRARPRAPTAASAPAAPAPAPALPVGTPAHPVRFLLTDVRNDTGEVIFDRALEVPLEVILMGTPSMSHRDRDELRLTARAIQPDGPIEMTTWRQAAARVDTDVLLLGSVAKQGSAYRVAVRMVGVASGDVLLERSEVAQRRDAVLAAVGELAIDLREAVGDPANAEVKGREARMFSASSLQAMHELEVTTEYLSHADNDAAIAAALRTVALDPKLGLAYATHETAYAAAGDVEAVDKYYELMTAHGETLNDRTRRNAQGIYYLAHHDPRAVQTYLDYVEHYPVDLAGISNLAGAYQNMRDFTRQLDWERRAAKLAPDSPLSHANIALAAVYSGDFDLGLREAQATLAGEPSCTECYDPLAVASLGLDRPRDAEAAYRAMAALGPSAASSASLGLADLALYAGDADGAIRILEDGERADASARFSSALAVKRAVHAEALVAKGRRADAAAVATRASASAKDPMATTLVGRVFVTVALDAPAMAAAKALATRVEPDWRAYGKLIEGELLLSRGQPRQAIERFEEARTLADTWLGRFDLGRAHAALGEFAPALEALDECTRRRSEALLLFIDDSTFTARLWPPALYWRARAEEGQGLPRARTTYEAFLAIRGGAAADPTVIDARGRLAAMRAGDR